MSHAFLTDCMSLTACDRHYEDCYDTLAEMFPQTTLLQPRTKRWAEAKVLADCLSAKVSLG